MINARVTTRTQLGKLLLSVVACGLFSFPCLGCGRRAAEPTTTSGTDEIKAFVEENPQFAGPSADEPTKGIELGN